MTASDSLFKYSDSYGSLGDILPYGTKAIWRGYDISNNPDILNPFKFPINNNKIYNKDYNILLPHKFKVQNSTLFFYILYFLILIFSIIKYVNLN